MTSPELTEEKHRTAALSLGRINAIAGLEREDLVLPASYANFYIANTCVLVPTYADKNDMEAIRIIQRAFPKRLVKPIDCRELIWGLGAFHCLTQQQPKTS